MRKQKNFTEEQKNKLLKSPYIEKVYSNHIVYSSEFKQLAITKYEKGCIPVQIFLETDLDLELIGKKNATIKDLKYYNKMIDSYIESQE